MRQKIYVGILSVLLSVSVAEARESWNGRILDVKKQSPVTLTELSAQMARFEYVVLGEKHYTNSVQLVEAALIENIVASAGAEGRFTTAWEFLNYTNRNSISDLFSKFMAGKITAGDFLLSTQGNPTSYSYAPVLEVTKKLRGELFATNLSSKEKAPIVKDGIGAADPAFVPAGFALGGEFYKERFAEAMGGHAPPEKLDNYFAAQSLTDDFMAFHMAEELKTSLNFMIVGSFHSDYLDGFVTRLHVRAPRSSVAVIKIVDASDFAEEELIPNLKHSRYGEIADFVYFVNEPRK
ncbi:MAG: ChaN family lipoprotein [Bdellovibrionota bacterium]